MAELVLAVAGLIPVAAKAFKSVSWYIKHAKDADEEAIRLSSLVSSLYATLQGISLVASEFRDDGDVFAAYHSQVTACRKSLDKLCTKLTQVQDNDEESSSRFNIRRRIKWPFAAMETTAIQKDIEAHQKILALALTTEDLATTLKALQGVESLRADVQGLRDCLNARIRIDLSERGEKLLSAIELCRLHHTLRANMKLKHRGTGEWFIKGVAFQKWVNADGSCLWVYGIPGAGKSILASAAICYALERSSAGKAVSYFFCDYKSSETQVSRNVLGSIAAQIAQQDEECFECLRKFIWNHCDKERLQAFSCDHDDLIGLITLMAERLIQVTVLVDGLDECGQHTRTLAHCLLQLSTENTNVHLMLSSRDIGDIRDYLGTWALRPRRSWD